MLTKFCGGGVEYTGVFIFITKEVRFRFEKYMDDKEVC